MIKQPVSKFGKTIRSTGKPRNQK